jgi:hypothetical protein
MTQSKEELREQIIHGLRMRGWSRIEAENEADNRIARAIARDSATLSGEDEA